MRYRTPSILWLPFVFSVGGISWALLVASLALLSVLVISPVAQEVKDAQAIHNDVKGTLALLDQKIAVQRVFADEATSDPLLMQRLAAQQLHLQRPDEEILVLDPAALNRDRSVRSLLARSLADVRPEPVEPMPWFCEPATNPQIRPLLLALACAGMLVAFLLGVRYEPRPR